VNARLAGFLLFLPVPLVLWLFTAQPLGAVRSLALGAALMVSHRLYARPWALARAEQRCLWCGTSGAPLSIDLLESLGETRWAACSRAHANKLNSFLAWASRRTVFLRMGILGSLLVLLVVSIVPALVTGSHLLPADGPALFRLGVALTVLPLGWLGSRSEVASPGRLPFPVHIQALIGTLTVSYLFRLVGLVWSALGIRHILSRLT